MGSKYGYEWALRWQGLARRHLCSKRKLPKNPAKFKRDPMCGLCDAFAATMSVFYCIYVFKKIMWLRFVMSI